MGHQGQPVPQDLPDLPEQRDQADQQAQPVPRAPQEHPDPRDQRVPPEVPGRQGVQVQRVPPEVLGRQGVRDQPELPGQPGVRDQPVPPELPELPGQRDRPAAQAKWAQTGKICLPRLITSSTPTLLWTAALLWGVMSAAASQQPQPPARLSFSMPLPVTSWHNGLSP